MKEIWAKIDGYVDLYEVSSFGRIRSIGRELGFNSSSIIGVAKGRKKYKTAYGYVWKYKLIIK
ncbi:MAG: hypothetical protein LBR26_03250 [Prevotella sp.]|jgi:hypothetical protein|nr:hypothetical protein [Prevotella sp.]